MEDEAQKTVALKKAYAEIILNTAKEAAARVMASERRALRSQQDLCATKDESLRMLLRLKQMIDSKTTEAEMTSLSQRRRIEELEAQLNEAEDVISDLRTDLEQLWDELEKVKNNQRQSLNGRVMKEDASSHKNVASEPVVPPPSTSGLETVATSDMKNSPLDQRVSVNRSCNMTKETEQLSVSLLENYSSNNSDFASIITSSKEPELYRNGFTQRIRAFERTILDGQVPSSGDVDDQHSLKKNELITKVIDKEDGKGSLPSTRTKHKEMVNSPEEEEKKPVKVCMLRRKRTRFGKAKATSRKCRPGQLMKPSQPSSGLPCRKKNGNVKSANGACALPFIKGECVNMISKSSVSDEKLQHKSSCHKEEVKVVHKGKGKRKMKRRDAAASISSHPNQLSEPCQPSSILSRCRTLSYLVNSNVKSGEDRLKIIETEVNTKPMTCLDPGLTLIRSDVDPISGSTNLSISIKAKEINKSGLAQNAVEMDTVSLDESVLVKHEGDAAENLTIQSSELDLGMVKMPLMDSYSKQTKASEEMNGSPSQADNNGLLRYTFQRKRKKESLSNSDENTYVEDSAIKRRVGEMQSGAPEPQNSSLINESSRDSRRLIQVARQLISLSGKRW